MRKLTKDFRVVYRGEVLVAFLDVPNTETLLPEDTEGAEFDTREEASEFIKDKKLTHEYAE